MNRITKMYHNARWNCWLDCFLVGLKAVVLLIFILWVARHDIDISKFKIDLREANKKIESNTHMIDILSGVKEIKD